MTAYHQTGPGGLPLALRVESRSGAVAVGSVCLLSAPFVWRCPSNLAIAPFPLPARRTERAVFPHSALGQVLRRSHTAVQRGGAHMSTRPLFGDNSGRRIAPSPVPTISYLPSLWPATRSATPEFLVEFCGFPISDSSSLCIVSLEPGPLSSTGITRLHRYYEPLRHPAVPSSAPHEAPVGCAHSHTAGLPVLPLSSSFVHAVVSTPAQSVGACFAHFPTNDRLPRAQVGSACALPFSRPAQRSLALRPARLPSP